MQYAGIFNKNRLELWVIMNIIYLKTQSNIQAIYDKFLPYIYETFVVLLYVFFSFYLDLLRTMCLSMKHRIYNVFNYSKYIHEGQTMVVWPNGVFWLTLCAWPTLRYKVKSAQLPLSQGEKTYVIAVALGT